jgi:transposase-like protein
MTAHHPPLPELGQRWTTARKQTVVEAVRLGGLTLSEVCQRYALSVEEFAAWQTALARYGRPGLRSTRLQIYRDTEPGASHQGRPRHYYAACHS